MGKTTDAHDIEEAALAARVGALVDRGLERYGEGDLVGALSEWEHALALQPGSHKAEEYIRYVRDNFELLEEQFEEARLAAQSAAEAGLPVGQVGRGDARDDDAYDEISFEDGYASLEIELAPLAPASVGRAGFDVDQGWGIHEIAAVAPLPPTPEAFDSPGLEVVGDGLAGVAGGEIGDGGAELARDAALRAPHARHEAARRGAARGEPMTRGRDDAGGRPPADRAEFDDALTIDLDHDENEEPTRSHRHRSHDAGAGAGAGAGRGAALADSADDDLALEIDFGDSERAQGAPSRAAVAVELDDALMIPGSDALAAHDDVGLGPAGLSGAAAARPGRSGIGAGRGASPSGETDEPTAPGGDQPPPLEERPSASDMAIAGHGRRPRADARPPAGGCAPVTFRQAGTGEQTLPARPSATLLGIGDAFDFELGAGAQLIEDDDEIGDTRERHGTPSWRAGAPLGADDLGGGDDLLGLGDPGMPVIIDDALAPADDVQTGQLVAIREEVPAPEPGEPALLRNRDLPDGSLDDLDELEYSMRDHAVITGARPVSDLDALSMDVVAHQLAAELEAPPVGDPDPIRHRVSALLDRAETEHAAGRHPLAVAALDLALNFAPDSAAAQKLIQNRRASLVRICEQYLGDLGSVPVVALPTHEIVRQQLDSRAAFLLSRIDGMLTFEEVLDVAGMSRLEAYRHLCRLLLRGVLEVR
jgi:hypothetical protein